MNYKLILIKLILDDSEKWFLDTLAKAEIFCESVESLNADIMPSEHVNNCLLWDVMIREITPDGITLYYDVRGTVDLNGGFQVQLVRDSGHNILWTPADNEEPQFLLGWFHREIERGRL